MAEQKYGPGTQGLMDYLNKRAETEKGDALKSTRAQIKTVDELVKRGLGPALERAISDNLEAERKSAPVKPVDNSEAAKAGARFGQMLNGIRAWEKRENSGNYLEMAIASEALKQNGKGNVKGAAELLALNNASKGVMDSVKTFAKEKVGKEQEEQRKKQLGEAVKSAAKLGNDVADTAKDTYNYLKAETQIAGLISTAPLVIPTALAPKRTKELAGKWMDELMKPAKAVIQAAGGALTGPPTGEKKPPVKQSPPSQTPPAEPMGKKSQGQAPGGM